MDNKFNKNLDKLQEKHFDEVSDFLTQMGMIQKENKKTNEPRKIDAKKILIVDDNEMVRELIRSIFANDDVLVLEASNGKDAIKVFGQHPNLSLLLVDLQMPEMNGFQFLQLAKSLKALDGIPVMIVTAFTNDKIIANAKKFQISHFVVKPFDPEALRRKVLAILRPPSVEQKAG